MKKIKITEKQAELLGLNKINENEESGVKSVNTAIGDAVVRMVVFGDAVPKFKDRILQLINRQDNNAKVSFFDQTGKIVGNVKEVKLDSIKRDLKALDPTIMVEKKPIAKSLKEGVKNILKISKTQCDRIFGMVNESDPKGGLNRVDKTFKKEFAGQDIQNLKKVSEEKFNINKPNKSVPKLSEGEEAEDPLKKEVLELIKYLYRKSERLSPFWEQNGMDYDAICDTLLSKNIIVKNGGRYELAKSLGNPQTAIQAVEDALRTHIKPQTEEPIGQPELETEDSGYPAGAEHDSAAPYNQQEPDTTSPKQPKQVQLEPIAFNREVILFKSPDGAMYVFYHDNIDKNALKDYASLTRHYVGKDEEGQPDYDYDDDFEINADVISHYVNDNLESLSKGVGLDDYEQGVDLVKVDDSLKQELLSLYDKDKNMVKILNPIEEADFGGAMDSFKQNLQQAATPSDKPKIPQSKIVAKLAELKAKEEQRRAAEQAGIDKQFAGGEVDEMTSSASSGAFVAPMSGDIVKKEMPATPVVAEISTVASAGNFQYDTPGGLTMDLGKSNPKTKAEKTTQWAGGSFVKQPDCSKPNNNKSAQNGGCNSGASSLKTVKSGGSINAPSLGENEIYEAIAKKTGKTLDEVKRIINSKNNKA